MYIFFLNTHYFIFKLLNANRCIVCSQLRFDLWRIINQNVYFKTLFTIGSLIIIPHIITKTSTNKTGPEFQVSLCLCPWFDFTNLHSFKALKELSFWYKLEFSNSYSFAKYWFKPLVFQTLIIYSLIIHSLKYIRFTTLGHKLFVFDKGSIPLNVSQVQRTAPCTLN